MGASFSLFPSVHFCIDPVQERSLSKDISVTRTKSGEAGLTKQALCYKVDLWNRIGLPSISR